MYKIFNKILLYYFKLIISGTIYYRSNKNALYYSIINKFYVILILYYSIINKFCDILILYYSIINKFCVILILYYSIINKFCVILILYYSIINKFCVILMLVYLTNKQIIGTFQITIIFFCQFHIIFEDQLIKSWWLPTCHVTGWIVDNICLFFFIPHKSSSCSNLLHIKSPNMPYKYDCMIADLHRVSHFSAKSYKNNDLLFHEMPGLYFAVLGQWNNSLLHSDKISCLKKYLFLLHHAVCLQGNCD